MNSYRVSSNYGWRTHPISGKRSFHKGIDLVKKHQAPIYSFSDGRVLFAGTGKSGTGLGGYGKVVFIIDSNGRGLLYAHLDSVSVSFNQPIKKGQMIGRQGNTGNSTGSHLHFEVRKKTSPSYGWSKDGENTTLDPVKYIESLGGRRIVKKIKVDGYLGKETIRRTQQFFGTPMDGKLSKPSLVIKNLQKFLNQFTNRKIQVDGYFGKDSIQSLQTFLKTPIDGKISEPSLVIKEWQKFLNSYGQ